MKPQYRYLVTSSRCGLVDLPDSVRECAAMLRRCHARSRQAVREAFGLVKDVQYFLSRSATCSQNKLATLSPDCPLLKAIAIYQQRGEGRNQASAFYEHIAQMEVVSLCFTYKTYTVLLCVAPLQNWWLRLTHTQQGTKQAKKQTNPRLSGICLDYGNLSEGHLAADKAVSASSHLFAWIGPSFSFWQNITSIYLCWLSSDSGQFANWFVPFCRLKDSGSKKEIKKRKSRYHTALHCWTTGNHSSKAVATRSDWENLWFASVYVATNCDDEAKGFQCKCIPSVCHARLCCTGLSYALIGKLSAGSFHGFVFHLAKETGRDSRHERTPCVVDWTISDKHMTDEAFVGQLEDAVGMVEEVQCKCKWRQNRKLRAFILHKCTLHGSVLWCFRLSQDRWASCGSAERKDWHQISTWSAWNVTSMKRHIANYESMIKVFRYRQKWEKYGKSWNISLDM